MKERSDAKKNKAKIVKSVLNNPLQSQREIAQEANVGKTTVQEHLKTLKTTKDDRIVGICDKDLENVTLGQEILMNRLKNKPDEMKTSDIVQVMNEGTKRYAIFKGDATDENGGLKKVEGIKIEIG